MPDTDPADSWLVCPRCHMKKLAFWEGTSEAVCLGTVCFFREAVGDRTEFEKRFGRQQQATSNGGLEKYQWTPL